MHRGLAPPTFEQSFLAPAVRKDQPCRQRANDGAQGEYSSAVPLALEPPATRTLPLNSSVAVWA